MKATKELSEFHNELLLRFENIDSLFENYKKKIKKETQDKIIKEKNKLLIKISEGEKLDLNKLKLKYLKPKEIALENNEKNIKIIEIDNLLDKIMIDDNIYYYENKEIGKVFNADNKEIGVFKNGCILFNIDADII